MNITVGANNRIQTAGYGYDAAGNMTNDGSGHNFSYDAENRITALAGYNYTYDADGDRVMKITTATPATGTLYWYASLGIVAESDLSGTIKSEYVFFNGNRIARCDLIGTPAVSYYFSDHLKTASVETDATGDVKDESDFYPWGESFSSLTATTIITSLRAKNGMQRPGWITLGRGFTRMD